MRWIMLVATFFIGILLGAPKPVVEAVTFPTLYDNFGGKLIDPDRWVPVVLQE